MLLHVEEVEWKICPQTSQMKLDNSQLAKKNVYFRENRSCYLVLDGRYISFCPPVQRLRDVQEAGLLEKGPNLQLCFRFVALHNLPELLLSLWEMF